MLLIVDKYKLAQENQHLSIAHAEGKCPRYFIVEMGAMHCPTILNYKLPAINKNTACNYQVRVNYRDEVNLPGSIKCEYLYNSSLYQITYYNSIIVLYDTDTI